MMAERGLSLAHTTIMRWVQHYAPEFEKRWRRYALAVGRSCRVDETYVLGGRATVSIVRYHCWTHTTPAARISPKSFIIREIHGAERE
jgi:hypothetical protein